MSTAPNSFTTASSLKKKLRKAIIERNAEVCLRILKDITLSMTFGIDVSVFFTEVVMASETSNVAIKKLVYMYISCYYNTQKDMTMLSLNTLLKDSRDPSPMVRGLAIRTLSSLHVPDFVQYINPVIKSGLEDNSPYVRRCSIIACGRMVKMDPNYYKSCNLVDTLYQLIRDENSLISINALNTLDIILKDEGGVVLNKAISEHLILNFHLYSPWSQCTITQFLCKLTPVTQEFMLFTLNKLDSYLVNNNISVVLGIAKLFLTYTEKFPKIRNDLVVRLKEPLLYSIKISRDENVCVILAHIWLLLRAYPNLFNEQYKHFFVKELDPPYVAKRKLAILAKICTDENLNPILSHLVSIMKDHTSIVLESISTLFIINSIYREQMPRVVEELTRLIDHMDHAIIVPILSELNLIIDQLPETFFSYVIDKVDYSKIHSEKCLVNLLYIIGIPNITSVEKGKFILTECYKDSAKLSVPVKLQLLQTSYKLYTSKSIELSLFQRVLSTSIKETDPLLVQNALLMKRAVDQGLEVTLPKIINSTSSNSSFPMILKGDHVVDMFNTSTIYCQSFEE